MLHLYHMNTDRAPREGDVAACGHVLTTKTKDEPTDKRCPICLNAQAFDRHAVVNP